MKTNRLKIFLFLTIFILINTLLSGCTQTVQTSLGEGKLVFKDDFKDANSGWFIYKPADTKGGKYENGTYNVWTTTKDTVIVLNPKLREQYGDFAAEVDVKKTSTAEGALLGLIYRLDNDGNYYRFCISDNQTYHISRGLNGFEQQLNQVETSEIIKPAGEYNSLKLVCKGVTQDLYINGNKLDSISDNVSLKGEIGIAFSNWAENAAYSFTNFKLYKIE